MSEISPKPNILWRLFVLGGIGTSAVVSIDDDAWEAFDEATGHTMNRNAIRAVFGGTIALHALEGGAAFGSARKAGLRRPFRWGLSGFMWGFPVLLRLRRAKRAELLD